MIIYLKNHQKKLMKMQKRIVYSTVGGLQEQVTDGEQWFGVGIKPSSKAVIGSQEVPYIYEDRVSKEDVVNAMLKMFNMSKAEREQTGKKAREYVLKKYNLASFAKKWEEVMDSFVEKNGSWHNRKNYSHYTVGEY